jgi:hypothetical protein
MLHSSSNTYWTYAAETPSLAQITNVSAGPLIIKVRPGKELEDLVIGPRATEVSAGVSNLTFRQTDANAASEESAAGLFAHTFFFPHLEVFQELWTLLAEEKDDPESCPTAYAIRLAVKSVVKARELLGYAGLHQTFAGDGTGGIRVEWKVGRREVRLIIPANDSGKAYIYSRNEKDSHVDFSASPGVLAETLRAMFLQHR